MAVLVDLVSSSKWCSSSWRGKTEEAPFRERATLVRKKSVLSAHRCRRLSNGANGARAVLELFKELVLKSSKRVVDSSVAKLKCFQAKIFRQNFKSLAGAGRADLMVVFHPACLSI